MFTFYFLKKKKRENPLPYGVKECGICIFSICLCDFFPGTLLILNISLVKM